MNTHETVLRKLERFPEGVEWQVLHSDEQRLLRDLVDAGDAAYVYQYVNITASGRVALSVGRYRRD